MHGGKTQLLIDNPINRYLINSSMLLSIDKQRTFIEGQALACLTSNRLTCSDFSYSLCRLLDQPLEH